MATIDIHPQTSTHHHDDHAHEHEHHGNFWTNYVFSEDHKVIAKQFLITGMAWALIGGVLSVLFRLQLGFPDADLSWLKPILGGWLTPEGKIDPEFYLALGNDARNHHGVLSCLLPGLSGTFSNFLIPLQIGARDMASGFMNMLSYWFFFVSSVSCLHLCLFLLARLRVVG
jgi:cytochrome c oxidase subunit 1